MSDTSPDREYRFEVVPDPEGGYTLFYPDLPGCVTQFESLEELPQAAREIRGLWIESALEDGQRIPKSTDPTIRRSRRS